MKWLKTCPKSASYICQRIFVAFGKVNNTQGGDHLTVQIRFIPQIRCHILARINNARQQL